MKQCHTVVAMRKGEKCLLTLDSGGSLGDTASEGWGAAGAGANGGDDLADSGSSLSNSREECLVLAGNARSAPE